MTTTRRLSLAYLALTAGVAVLFALNLIWGSVSLTPGAVAAALLGRDEDALAVGIVLQLRLPRAVMVVLLGAALSAAGYLLQTFFANPIAGPFVMGVSSGAKLAVALTMVVFLQRGLLTSSATLIIAAFAGSMAAMAFVPVVCDYYSGMQVLVPLDLKLAGTSAEAVAAGIADYYKEGATVSVHALNEPLPENGLYSNALSGSDRMELYMTVNAAGDQMMLVSLFDNLGKGSSGAAVQCMNLMLGMNETEGLE